MITRRNLMVAAAGCAFVSAAPGLAKGPTTARATTLRVVDPALLAGAVPEDVLSARGQQQITALLPQLSRANAAVLLLNEADACFLAESLRFEGGARLALHARPAGCLTFAGPLACRAREVVVMRPGGALRPARISGSDRVMPFPR